MHKMRAPSRIGLRLLVAVSLVLPVTMVSGTAQASLTDALSGLYGTTFVDGADTLTDDWGDHFGELGNALCNGCADSLNNDLVVMWQAVLFTEGFLSESGMDGDFGPNTANATKSWQSRFGLAADGRVGATTWAKADDRLHWIGGGTNWAVEYFSSATGRSLIFSRGSNDRQDGGAYSMDGVYYPSGHEWGFSPQFIKVAFNQHKLSGSPVPCLC
jgi:hypothetical protein